MADSRDFQKQRMARAAWLVRRCPAREKAQSKAACMEAIKSYLDGVRRDAGGPVDQAERQSKG